MVSLAAYGKELEALSDEDLVLKVMSDLDWFLEHDSPYFQTNIPETRSLYRVAYNRFAKAVSEESRDYLVTMAQGLKLKRSGALSLIDNFEQLLPTLKQ